MNYLQKAVELARVSFEAGLFPAGAVLITKVGNIYTSDPSLAWYHGECSVIDKAIKAEGVHAVAGAKIFTTVESCLMCSAKMYWSGITEVTYIVPKSKTNVLYAYEDSLPMHEHLSHFNTPLLSTQDDKLLEEALALYNAWAQKIERK